MGAYLEPYLEAYLNVYLKEYLKVYLGFCMGLKDNNCMDLAGKHFEDFEIFDSFEGIANNYMEEASEEYYAVMEVVFVIVGAMIVIIDQVELAESIDLAD